MTMHGRFTAGQGIPADQVATLKKALKALDPFFSIRKTMPLQVVQALLLVATDPGHNVTWYADKAGISASLMTRHLADIGEWNRYHLPGLGLVEQFHNVMDKRERLLRLTAEGRRIAKGIHDALSG
jgi:DNA-binding MarR family transcriptional regulator